MSSKPWWYVKGRKDLIESRLSARHEKASHQAESAARNAAYFQRWRLQNQLFDHWAKNPSAAGGDAPDLSPPYGLDYDPFDTPERQRRLMVLKSTMDAQVQELWEQLRNLEREALARRQQEALLWTEIEQLMEIKDCLDNHRQTWDLKDRKCRYKKFAKDKLRLKTFHNNEQLNYYQLCIQAISSSPVGHLISDDEEVQLNQVVEASLNIIRNYIQLNDQRNSEFFILYNEEAELRLASQEKQWLREKKVWAKLVDSILDSYFTIYKSKLEQLIDQQEQSLSDRKSQLEALKMRLDEIRNDTNLKPFLNSATKNLGAMNLQDV